MITDRNQHLKKEKNKSTPCSKNVVAEAQTISNAPYYFRQPLQGREYAGLRPYDHVFVGKVEK